MTDIQWEQIEVPRGGYIGWGNKPGQHVTGKVLDYTPDGGTDYYQKPCPFIQIELSDKAASFNKEGERTDYPAGELVNLNAGQVSLQRALRAAGPRRGDMVKIELVNLVKTDKGTVKEFDLKIARGKDDGGDAKPKAKAAAAPADDDDPPF